MSRKSYYDYITKYPWYECWRSARRRCEDRSHKSYKSHGARGIKFLLTRDDCKFLWDRDNAGSLRIPSLDREDPDGDYTLENCAFIEFYENSKRHRPANFSAGTPDGAEALENWA